jgi:hypothetical protein
MKRASHCEAHCCADGLWDLIHSGGEFGKKIERECREKQETDPFDAAPYLTPVDTIVHMVLPLWRDVPSPPILLWRVFEFLHIPSFGSVAMNILTHILRNCQYLARSPYFILYMGVDSVRAFGTMDFVVSSCPLTIEW